LESTADRYSKRFCKVLDYIETHLDEVLSVEQLSEVAEFSRFHFHRQFSALFDIGLHRYVQLLRLNRATSQLAFRSQQDITTIALECGYDAPEAFARAFKKIVGQSPSAFRARPDWQAWQAAYQPAEVIRINHMSKSVAHAPISIVNFPETPIAVLEHRGDPATKGDSIRRFIAWRKQHKLPPRNHATFNLCYDDPDNTEPEHFRMDMCVAMAQPFDDPDAGIIAKVIPAGRCAVLRYIGGYAGLGSAAKYLYSQWLPQSGQEVRDFPFFMQRISFFPDVPEHEAVTDLFLPLE
jgi:AraC family transcriptional regulator